MSTTLQLLLISSTTLFLTACGSGATDPKAAQISANNTAKDMCSISIDDNNDGQLDRIVTQTRNSSQMSLSHQVDSNADGISDSQILYTYDEYDNPIKLELDNNADGTANAIIIATYDGPNHPLIIEQDANADGKNDLIFNYSYPSRKLTVVKIDTDSDGVIDGTITYYLDDFGRNTQEDTDNNNDGTIDSIAYNAYNDDNAKTPSAIAYDDNADGIIDRSNSVNASIGTTIKTQDSNRNWISEIDNNNDGTIDARVITSCKELMP